jgi:hypothetical protein
MGRHVILLDVLSIKATVCSAICFFLALIILGAIGGAGPSAVSWQEWQQDFNCKGALTSCPVAVRFQLPEVSPYNQAMWLTARFRRPTDGTGAPALASQTLTWTQNFNVSVIADGNQLADTSIHSTQVTCQRIVSNAPVSQNDDSRLRDCSGIFIFSAPQIKYKHYIVTIVFDSPTQVFSPVAGVSPKVQVLLRQGFIAKDYTSFEIGWKTTFCVFTGCLFCLYCFLTLRPNPLVRIKQLSISQTWWLILGFFCFFFADPSFLSYVMNPVLTTAAFYFVNSVTFVALLLLYFLVAFDNARLQAEQGLQFSLDDENNDPSLRPGACFWVPKVLLITIVWTVLIAANMYTRIMQDSDPSFSLTENVAGPVAAWLTTFIAGLGGFYVLYIFALLVLCFRLFRTMNSANKFVVAVTVTTLIVTLAGLFGNSFSGFSNNSALFLVGTGVPIFYTWTMMILHLPAPNSWGGNSGSQKTEEWGNTAGQPQNNHSAIPVGSGEEIGENSNDRGARGGFKDDQPREASEDDIEIEAPPPVQFTAGNGRRNFDEPDPTESRRESIAPR